MLFPAGKGRIALYRSGIAKASKGDHRGAIADYAAAVGIPNLPSDLKAMVVYNRAVAYSAIHEEERAAEDVAAVLHMPGCPALIRVYAQERKHAAGKLPRGNRIGRQIEAAANHCGRR